MACSKSVATPALLTCVICTETYTDPCTLRCHHTFCRNCILHFLQTNHGLKAIPCPSCTLTTDVSDPSQPVEQWVEQLTPNPVVLGLMKDISPETKDRNSCFPCKAKGETVTSRFWCYSCEIAMCSVCHQTHGVIPSSRDHEVTELTRDLKIQRSRKVKCKEHPKHDLEFSCENCVKVICQVCCILYHRKCDTVATLESRMSSMKEHLKTKSETISKKITDMTQAIRIKRTLVAEEEAKKKEMETEIEERCQHAHDLITKRKKELLDDLSNKFRDETEKIQTKIKREKLDLQVNQQHKTYLDQVLEQECAVDMYNAAQASKADDVESFTAEGVVREAITLKSDPKKLKTALQSWMYIEVKSGNHINPDVTPAFQETIKTNEATDIAVVGTPGTDSCSCVTTYYMKKYVKLFHLNETSKREETLSLDNWAWGVTVISEGQVAVTVPCGYKILLFDISQGISIQKTITVRRQYFGLANVNNDTFAAGSNNGIHVLNMKGEILSTISNNYTMYPNFILSVDNGCLLVSDWRSKSVSRMTTTGTVQFVYSPQDQERSLKEAAGIVTSSNGYIFVADKEANKVILLTEDGSFVREVLTSKDGLAEPFGLTLHRGLLYVTQWRGPIKIFKLN